MKMKELMDFYRDKRVLVTGHTGFKGAWLCRILTLAGAQVTGYSLEPPTDPSLFEIAGLEDVMDSVIGDIRNLQGLKDVFARVRPEVVFHLAAQPIVRDSYKDPVYTYETNVMGTVNVMECVRLTDSVRSFLNVITDKVYELVTHSYQKSFFGDGRCAVSTSRAGNVIGGGDFANDRIIPDCIRAAATGKDIIVRNPHSTRPYQLVLEPLAVYLTIAMRQYEDGRYQGYYNVGPDDKDCVTTGCLVDMFCRLWGGDVKWVNQYDGGPHEANFLKLDCSRIKSVFGWRPRYGVEEAVEKTVEWSRAYLDGEDMLEVMDRQITEFFS